LRDDPEVRLRKDRAAPDDVRINGSRLGGRFAPLAGMTAVALERPRIVNHS